MCFEITTKGIRSSILSRARYEWLWGEGGGASRIEGPYRFGSVTHFVLRTLFQIMVEGTKKLFLFYARLKTTKSWMTKRQSQKHTPPLSFKTDSSYLSRPSTAQHNNALSSHIRSPSLICPRWAPISPAIPQTSTPYGLSLIWPLWTEGAKKQCQTPHFGPCKLLGIQCCIPDGHCVWYPKTSWF